MVTPEPHVMWRKSSYSTNNGDCVEVANTVPQVRVRDTKDRASGALTFAAPGWRAFLTALGGGH
ncbi:DUF397 domain-containing protein [Amycolatopsis sp.]|jgi:hypothetical protein|uniref:DUF397 domain-containing protein n=1 Tax=Amycolatopsis sp. TaxID=37632 RepID=UPI002DFFF416|nr:DUF397 domain-containing protein [Amycolatopsis sp.]